MSMKSPTTYSQDDLDLINSEISHFHYSTPTTSSSSSENQNQPKTTINTERFYNNVEEFSNTLNPLNIDELQNAYNIDLINNLSGKSEFIENENIPISINNSTGNVQPLMTIENVAANFHPEDGNIRFQCEKKSEKADELKSKQIKGLNFFPGDKLEAKDFNEKWYTAKVVETDWVEREVLIHFDKWSARFDEWIPMDSPRLRMLQTQSREMKTKDFVAGERILATWADGRKYPAKVNAVLGNDRYDVLFDDGYTKIVRSSKMSKLGGPLDEQNDSEDFIGSKEKRKDRNRKYQVMDLFQRKPKKGGEIKYAKRGRPCKEEIVPEPLIDNGSFSGSHDDSSTEVLHGFENPTAKVKTYMKKEKKDSNIDPSFQPEWKDGEPQGIESFIEGPRRSIIVADKRLPPGWVKHFTQRKAGSSAGKWDVLFIHEGSDKKFRSRNDIRAYMVSQGQFDFDPEMFDFCIHRKKKARGEKVISDTPPARRSKSSSRAIPSPLLPVTPIPVTPAPALLENSAVFIGGLRVEMEDSSYKCPKDGCLKNFRKENLLQMHIKHYHPEYSKFLGSTPNVADLAYARTIGESIDDIIPKQTHNFLEKINKFEKRKEKSQLPVLQALSPSQPIATAPSPTPPVLELEVNRTEESIPKDEKIELGSPLRTNSETLRKETDCAMSPGSLFDLKIREEKTSGIKTLLPVRAPDSRSKSVDEMMTPGQRGKSLRKRNLTDYHPDIPRVKKRQSIQDSNFEDLDESTMDTEGPATPTYRFSRRKSDAKNDESNDSKHEGMMLINGELIKVEQLRKEEIINCTCKFMEEDGLMIQCDLCLCWQHGHCNAIEKEKDVPDKYVCYICRHPHRQRPSMKYNLDQEWMKEGKLPTLSISTKNNDLAFKQRTAMLKRSYDLISFLFQIQHLLHSLRVKINVAQKKDHPKLYLWAKNWEKFLIPKPDISPVPILEIIENTETVAEVKKEENDNTPEIKITTDSDLVKILEDGALADDTKKENFLFSALTKSEDKTESDLKENLKTPLESKPFIPEPEAPIDPTECRMRLLEHIDHFQNYVASKLTSIEAQVQVLEEMDPDTIPEIEVQPRTKQTVQMLLRDLGTIRKLASLC
ncbi:PHD finger protein 20 [Leptopilina heterotoma]|uniref:PHD finger protein 20 n=1 Tax=Leptopilina heterotoma TaxID=63436 RepID=UPI001CA80B32|nr:PHD finger protein 20 [Leptopilina heterotoma]